MKRINFNKAIVTGAAGFIGSHLFRRLLDRGVDTLGLDNFSNVPDGRLKFLFDGRVPNISNVDILDRELVSKKIEEFGNCDIFFDLAYINGTKQFYTRPLEILRHAGRHVDESFYWARRLSARWIYFSTPEIYGEPDVVPTPEDHRVLVPEISNMRFSYSIGKIFSENYVHAALAGFNDLDAIILRPNNAYGPTDRFHVISDFLAKILDESPLTIQGTGAESRSFCYVEDMVDQILMVAENGVRGETYSIGSNAEISIAELVDLIIDITGYDKYIQKLPLAAGSPLRRCPDLGKVGRLGQLVATPLDDGLRETFKKEIAFRKFKNSLLSSK